MADDVLTRNSDDELALRVVQSTGDTGMNKDDVYTRDSQGRLSVRTVGGSAADVSFDPSGLDVITETNVQSALAQVDSSVKDLQDSVSVLTTSVELSTEIGGETTVALGDLTAMDIDGRPSYKQAGATVYAENGVVGIIDSVDSTNAVITTVQYMSGGGASLPDQTGNAGKFLMTDGTTASWGGGIITNVNTILGYGTRDVWSSSVAVGALSEIDGAGGTCVGHTSEVYDRATAIGCRAKATAPNAIQLGSTATIVSGHTNSDANTFKVGNANGNFEMMDADGNVPLSRLTYVTNQIGDISTALTAILGE